AGVGGGVRAGALGVARSLRLGGEPVRDAVGDEEQGFVLEELAEEVLAADRAELARVVLELRGPRVLVERVDDELARLDVGAELRRGDARPAVGEIARERLRGRWFRRPGRQDGEQQRQAGRAEKRKRKAVGMVWAPHAASFRHGTPDSWMLEPPKSFAGRAAP